MKMRKYIVRRDGLTLIELTIVVAIMALLFMIAQPSYKRHVERSRLKQGLHQLYNIKKAMEQYMVACRGYPWVDTGANLLIDVIDCCSPDFGTGNNPEIYPDLVECDTTTLQGIIPGMIYDDKNPNKYDACVYTDNECMRASNAFGGINKSFVQAPAGNPVSDLCATQFGWGYGLVPGASVLIKPTAVYCGAVGIYDGYGIIVIDSEGGGQMDPVGVALTNACTCGAWCYESITDSMGCCNNCDAGGTFKIPFRY